MSSWHFVLSTRLLQTFAAGAIRSVQFEIPAAGTRAARKTLAVAGDWPTAGEAPGISRRLSLPCGRCSDMAETGRPGRDRCCPGRSSDKFDDVFGLGLSLSRSSSCGLGCSRMKIISDFPLASRMIEIVIAVQRSIFRVQRDPLPTTY